MTSERYSNYIYDNKNFQASARVCNIIMTSERYSNYIYVDRFLLKCLFLKFTSVFIISLKQVHIYNIDYV